MNKTIAAYENQLLKLTSLQDENPEQSLYHSLTIFNESVDHLIEASPVSDFTGRLPIDFRANGMTALLDAVGLSICMINSKFGHWIENDEMSVVIMILTDGYENASRSFTYRDISQLIESLENTGKWSFSILGADLDVFSMAARMKMNRENVIAFSKSDINTVFDEYSGAMEYYIQAKKYGRIKKDYLDKIPIKDKRRIW